MHASTPPRSANRAVGVACSFEGGLLIFVRLLLVPSVVRLDLTFRFVAVVSAASRGIVASVGAGAEATGGSGGVGTSSGVGGIEFKFNFRLADHKPVIDRFSEFEACLNGY